MLNALTSLDITLVVGAAAFVAGVFLSQKVRDKINGVPSNLRADLKSVEQAVLNRVHAASSDVVAEVNAVASQVPPTPAASPAPAPAAPSAPHAA